MGQSTKDSSKIIKLMVKDHTKPRLISGMEPGSKDISRGKENKSAMEWQTNNNSFLVFSNKLANVLYIKEDF